MKKFIPALALLVFAAPAHAWNCSDPLAARVPVPAGTSGTFGDGDGQLFLGTGTEGVKGQLYECKIPNPNPPTGGSQMTQKQQQTQNQNSTNNNSNNNSNANNNTNNNSSNSASNSNSNSSSKSSSNSNSTSNSAVTNSGNSSSKSTSSASNNGNGNGNGSNNTALVTNVAAPNIPVGTAVGVAPGPTVSCFKGLGAGVQTMAFGGSLSGGKIDQNCAILETARSFASVGARLSYCKVMLTDKYAKKAGITLEDCMTAPPAITVPVQPIPVTPEAVPSIIINVPTAAPVEAPTPVMVPVVRLTDLGSFHVLRTTSAGVCPTVRVALGSQGIAILDHAIALGDGEIILSGNVYTSGVAVSYLRHRTRAKISVHALDEQDGNVSVQFFGEGKYCLRTVC